MKYGATGSFALRLKVSDSESDVEGTTNDAVPLSWSWSLFILDRYIRNVQPELHSHCAFYVTLWESGGRVDEVWIGLNKYDDPRGLSESQRTL